MPYAPPLKILCISDRDRDLHALDIPVALDSWIELGIIHIREIDIAIQADVCPQQ
jgi:hypothetical protein